MASPKTPLASLPAPDAGQFATMLCNAADLLLVLNGEGVIVDILAADGLGASFPKTWQGQRFSDLLGPESLSKLDALMARDAGREGSGARWRHLNLSDGAGSSVPMLLKYASVQGEGGVTGLLMARDLRPTIELQTRFRDSHRELEARLEAAPRIEAAARLPNGRPLPQRGDATRRAAAVIIDSMITRLGQHPLEHILHETCRVLERLCITEALERAQGNHAAAAHLLGISVEDLHLAMQP